MDIKKKGGLTLLIRIMSILKSVSHGPLLREARSMTGRSAGRGWLYSGGNGVPVPLRGTWQRARRRRPIRARGGEGSERVGSNSCPGEDEAP